MTSDMSTSVKLAATLAKPLAATSAQSASKLFVLSLICPDQSATPAISTGLSMAVLHCLEMRQWA